MNCAVYGYNLRWQEGFCKEYDSCYGGESIGVKPDDSEETKCLREKHLTTYGHFLNEYCSNFK